MYYSPLQVAPSSSNTKPLLHPQWKLPTVFVHVCEQPPLSSLHSLISGRTECIYEYFNNYIGVCISTIQDIGSTCILYIHIMCPFMNTCMFNVLFTITSSPIIIQYKATITSTVETSYSVCTCL